MGLTRTCRNDLVIQHKSDMALITEIHRCQSIPNIKNVFLEVNWLKSMTKFHPQLEIRVGVKHNNVPYQKNMAANYIKSILVGIGKKNLPALYTYLG